MNYDKLKEKGKRRIGFSRPFSFFLLILLLIFSVRPAAAHSGDGSVLRLSNASAGPFLINVWTYPSLVTPGTIHFSVAVTDEATGSPVPATAVFVQVTPMESENQTAQVSSRAILDFQSLLHETYLDIQETGDYEVTVNVATSTTEQGQASFELKVLSELPYMVITYVFVVITTVAVIWFLKEGLKTWGIEGWVRRRREASLHKDPSPLTQ